MSICLNPDEREIFKSFGVFSKDAEGIGSEDNVSNRDGTPALHDTICIYQHAVLALARGRELHI